MSQRIDFAHFTSNTEVTVTNELISVPAELK